MLKLNFDGWFQCRLASDPEPPDEPRGVSGWIFALAGEPDLDRVIRLQEPIAPRYWGGQQHEVGVKVHTVQMNERVLTDHPLEGATVTLLDDPKYEGRSGIIGEPGYEIIHPFHLIIETQDITIRLKDHLDPKHPERMLYELDLECFARRRPLFYVDGKPVVIANTEVDQVTGVNEYAHHGDQRYYKYREARRAILEQDRANLPEGTDSLQLLALDKRIKELAKDPERGKNDPKGRIPVVRTLGASLVYSFPIRGVTQLEDPRNLLGGSVDTASDWSIWFWMGGWDADALCGFMRGHLSVPFRLDPG